jgi:hypothetical protein
MQTSLGDKLGLLPQHLIELLVGRSGFNNLSQYQLLSLGDRILNLLAVVGCHEYLCELKLSGRKGNCDLDVVIQNLFTESSGLSIGVSCCMIGEFGRESGSKNAVGLYAINDELLLTWTTLRKDVGMIRRTKQLFMLWKKILDQVEAMLDTLRDIRDQTKANALRLLFEDPKSFAESFPEEFPLACYETCDECRSKHLYMYDRYLDDEEAFVYTNWGLLHIYQSRGKGRTGCLPGRGSESHMKAANTGTMGNSVVSIVPLFADSFPAMNRLADMLTKETEESTKDELWRQRYHGETNDRNGTLDIKSLIILDCIKRNPIEVLRDVSAFEPYEEGLPELERYARRLARSRYGEAGATEYLSEIKRRIDDAKKGLDANDRVGRKHVKDDILAYEVAQLLGFPVKRVEDLHNLEHYHDIIRELGCIVRGPASPLEERGAFKEGAEVLERVMREVCRFYAYLSYRVFPNGKCVEEWKQMKADVDKMAMGALFDLLRRLNEESKAISHVLEYKIGRPQYFQHNKFNRITRAGTADYIVALRNRAIHGVDEKRDDKTIDFVEAIEKIMEFMGDKAWRVYPFKINFTIMTKTSHGVRTCQYVTNLSGGEGAESAKGRRERIIYTEMEVDFMKSYYCLPNSRRCYRDIWVDPLLVPMEDIAEAE